VTDHGETRFIEVPCAGTNEALGAGGASLLLQRFVRAKRHSREVERRSIEGERR
jgi:hypothetical protein